VVVLPRRRGNKTRKGNGTRGGKTHKTLWKVQSPLAFNLQLLMEQKVVLKRRSSDGESRGGTRGGPETYGAKEKT